MIATASAGVLPSLSVVMPALNAEEWVEPTLRRLGDAVAKARWPVAEIIVVDDGSTDATSEAAEKLDLGLEIRVIRTENRGRLLARQTGIEAATGELVLLLDSRVWMDVHALEYVAGEMAADPERVVWNAHVEIELRGNPYARFWHAVTFVAWRRYLANPRLVSFTDADFDFYPKGTTCFLAPRGELLASYETFSSHYDDLRRANDDTSLLRGLAARRPIHLSPGFSCTYHSRETLRGFAHHTYYRGMVFVDGYLRPGTRWFLPLVAFLCLSPVGGLIALKRPRLAAAVTVAGATAAATAAGALGVPGRSAVAFGSLLPGFAAVYGAGIWTGVAAAVKSALRRS